MATVTRQPLPARAAYTDQPILRLTVEQYHQMIESGSLTDEDPVELLEGLLVYHMPKHSMHVTSNALARDQIVRQLPQGWHYRSQDPITLADGEPEPDGAVVRGKIVDYARSHPRPTDIALVIEIADSSLERDRTLKLRSYARAGIIEYWIINLIEHQIEVHTQPTPGDMPHYANRVVYLTDASVPLTLSGQTCGEVKVSDLTPAT